VRIDGELYWDGGILSNTPTEAIFDDNPRRSALIFAVHMWHPFGPEPTTMFDVMHRFKDIQFSSRLKNHIARQLETHRLRQIISQLAKHVPQELRMTPAVREMASYGCTTRMHIVQLLAPRLDNEDHMKEMDFSPYGIRTRWQAGYADTRRALALAPWLGEFSPLEGVILHDLGDNADRLTTKTAHAAGAMNRAAATMTPAAVMTPAAKFRGPILCFMRVLGSGHLPILRTQE